MRWFIVFIGIFFTNAYVANAQIITTIAGNGIVGYCCDGGPATAGQFQYPIGITKNHSGHDIFVVDEVGQIRKIDSVGIITSIAGSHYSGAIHDGDGGSATASGLESPFKLAFDNSGNLFISQAAYTVRKINTLGIINCAAGRYDTCSACGVIDGEPATTAYLHDPATIATDDQGNLYISDERAKIYKVDTSGIITTFAGTGVGGFSGDGGPATDAEAGAISMVFDGVGNMFFSDEIHVRKIDAAGIISTIAGTGTSTFLSGEGGPATAAGLSALGISLDRLGNVFIADYYNSRIRKISPDGIITTVAGTGYQWGDYQYDGDGYNGDGIQATDAELNFPTDVYVDVAENIFIVDNQNYRIRKVNGISGDTAVCVGATLTLTDIAPGGVWSSSNSNATVSGGVVTGVAAGTSVITYYVALPNDTAFATINVKIDNVYPVAGTIAGAASVCQGSHTSLTDPYTYGVWSVSNGHASITGGVVTGVTGGMDTVMYSVTNACGTATTTKTLSVTPYTAGTITGDTGVCHSTNITLTDAVTGGSWSARNTKATITSGGIVTGVTVGTDTITYSVTNSCGTARAMQTISISPTPVAGLISGPDSACASYAYYCTDTVAGGYWSIGRDSISASGVYYPTTLGRDTIRYSVSNYCGTVSAIKPVVVQTYAIPSAIEGLSSVCLGSTITLTDGLSGGIWSVYNNRASVSGGVITTSTMGLDTIKYTVTNSCALSQVLKVISVDSTPVAGNISGASALCAGSSASLSESVAGGFWSTSGGYAAVSTSGTVTGVLGGVDTIRYTYTNACGSATVTHIVTINPYTAGNIAGSGVVCLGGITTLTDTTTGGMWTVTNDNATIVSGTGEVVASGHHTGKDTIKYSVTNMCGTAVTVRVISINPLPEPGTVTGTDSVCAGAAITLSDTVAGGVWSVTNSHSFITTAGVLHGYSGGTDTVRYEVTVNGCTSVTSFIARINPPPNAGILPVSPEVCVYAPFIMNDTIPGGLWSESSGAGTIVDGVYTGLHAGTDIVHYTVTNECGATTVSSIITIKPLPDAGVILGDWQLCRSGTLTLTATAPSGIWLTTNATAEVSAGVVMGVTAGVDTVCYLVSNSCGTDTASLRILVNDIPVCLISGDTIACTGKITTLYGSPSGGEWSELTGKTTVTGGHVQGLSEGRDTIIYRYANACGSDSTRIVVQVGPMPDAGYITGLDSICVGSSITLTDTTTMGAWVVANGLTTINNGVVTGMAEGMETVFYLISNNCGTDTARFGLYINSIPPKPTITGVDLVCTGRQPDTLHVSLPGGVWSTMSGNATVAANIVTGVGSGWDTVVYAITNICGANADSFIIFIPSVWQCDSILTTTPVAANNNPVLVFPNPNDGRFTIQLHAQADGSIISITDMPGRIIRNITTSATEIPVDLSDLTAGTYLVIVQSGTLVYWAKITVLK